MFFIESVNATPNIDFVDPTPSDGTNTTDTTIGINVSITEPNLAEVKFNWNDVNYTFYDNSLVLMYNFDNVSALGENDTYVVDVSRYSNNGTVSNVTIWNETGGVSGGAYRFYQGNGIFEQVSVPFSQNLNVSNMLNGFTISFWINPLDEWGNTTYFFYTYSSNFNIDLYNSSTSNSIEFTIYNDSTKMLLTWAGHGIDENSGWTYLTFMFNGTTMTSYKNGVLGASLFTGELNPDTMNTTNTAYSIGGANDATNFAGYMDNIMIFNRSLSADEINQLYYGNLYKYDSDKWALYTNESLNNVGKYNYFATASNIDGSENLTETRTTTLLSKTTQYYDNRKMAAVWTGDYCGANVEYEINASNYAQSNKVVFSIAITTATRTSSDWTAIQTEIDEGFVSPVSHSAHHLNSPYDNDTSGTTTYGEVCGSQQDITNNLTLPWQDQFNGSEYLVGLVEPGGDTDSTIRGNLSACNYLSDRTTLYGSTRFSSSSWASWASDGLYNIYGITTQGDTDNLTTLNDAFDGVYSLEGIYHLYMHPYNHNWSEDDKIPQHLAYIGNKTDVWYVGWGDLYSYHYLEDQLKPTMDLTAYNNQIITAEINTSGDERNKYGLSYPITYAFAIPSVWSNVFVSYKNQSSDDYTLMTEKTRDEYWNGIDAYRKNLSENAVYVSKGFPQEYNEFYLKIVPILSTNFGGSTTDLTSESDLSNITNLVIEETTAGKINFTDDVNLSGGDLNTYVNISYNRVEIDSTNLPALNKSATLTLYNLSFSNPRILKDGEVCPSDICTKLSYTSEGNLTFTVTSFSVYSTEETPVTTPSSGGDSTAYTGVDTTKPDTYWLYLGDELEFTLNSKIHFIKPTYTSTDFVDLEISSEPIKVRINLGEFKLIDLDKDGIEDIKITLNSIQYSKVSLTVDYLNNNIKQIGVIEGTLKPGEIKEENITKPIEEPSKEEIKETRLSKNELFVILGVIVVLSVFYFKTPIISFFSKNKKRKRK